MTELKPRLRFTAPAAAPAHRIRLPHHDTDAPQRHDDAAAAPPREQGHGDPDAEAAARTAIDPRETIAPEEQVKHRPRAWQRDYRARLVITDSAIVLAALTAGYLARFGTTGAGDRLGDIGLGYSIFLPLIGLVWVAALSLAHSRDPRAVGLGSTEYKRVISASAYTFGLIAIALLIAKVDIARGYFVLALPLGTIGLLADRWGWRQWLLARRAAGGHLTRAIVVGWPRDVAYVVGQVHATTGSAYRIVGISLYESDRTEMTIGDRRIPVISTDVNGVARAAARVGAETVIVAGQPQEDSDFIRGLSWQLEGTATEMVLASRLVDVAGPRIHFRPVEGMPLIHVEIPQFDGGKHILKRTMDVAASAIALTLLSPAMAVIAAVIRLDSRGPAIFRQTRVGRDGALFTMYKFRSMVTDAEDALAALAAANEGSGPLFKLRDDPRVTRVGRVLRKYSLDELPQLWNVLTGTMSLVGPRPPLEREVAEYNGPVGRRLYIKPGLTGPWQVSGRSDLSWDESVRLDLYYVENWSVIGDLVLIWRTVKVLLHPVGAY